MFGSGRQLADLEQRLDELRSLVEALDARFGELASEVEELRAQRLQETHVMRNAAAKAEVALRRADEVASDRPGRLEALSAQITKLEQATGEQLETLAARLRHAVGDISAAQLVGGGLEDGPDLSAFAGEPFALHGWALVEPGSVAQVEVTIDGKRAEHVQMALPRTDVAAHHAHPDAPMSGFDVQLCLPEDASGKLLLDAVAVAQDRSRLRIGTVAVSVAPASPAEFEAGDVALRHQSERRKDAPRPRSAEALRLAVFAHSLDYGGAELRMLDLLNALADEPGFETLVVSGRPGPLHEELERLGATVHVAQGWGVGSVEAYEAWQQEIAALVQEWRPTAALAVTLASFAGVDVAGRVDVPCAWSIHETTPLPLFLAFGFPFEDRVHRYAASRAAAVFRTADALIFEAEASRRAYSAYGGDERAVLVPPGIDLDGLKDYGARNGRSAARREVELDEESTMLLAVGVLQPRKAQSLLVQAFRDVVRRHPGLVLALVGDRGGGYAEGLRELVSRSELEDRVRIVPAQRDVLPWFAAADLFVSASYEETVPGVILEAAVFGLPVLSTAVGGIPELIEDGVSGFLCAPRDLTALVDGLERLLVMTQEQRRRMTSEAKGRVHERHDMRARNERLSELLRSIARVPQSPASVAKS